MNKQLEKAMLLGIVGTGTGDDSSGSADPIGDALRADASAYYKGGNVNDSSANGLHLTNNNGVTFVAGKIDSAFLCDESSTAYLSRASNSLLEGDTSFTVAFWVNFPSFKLNQNMALVSKDGNCSGGYYVYAFGADPLVNIFFTIPDGDFGAPICQSSVNLVVDTWYFVAARYNATTKIIDVRVNATVDDVTGLFGDNLATTEPFTIGTTVCSGTPADYTDVKPCELGFWKQYRSNEDLDYLFNAGDGRTLFP